MGAIVGLCLIAGGCSLPSLKMPRVHKISVQQGNVITQEMIDRLKPGMSRSQVAYVMGEPVLRNTFNEDRWDYIYTLDIPGVLEQTVHMTLFFEGDALAYFTGDMAPTAAIEEVRGTQAEPGDPAQEEENTPATTPASNTTDTSANHQSTDTGAD